MNIMFYVIIFILGLCFGSFVNMLVYRTAVRYKLKKNPSVLRTSPFDLKGETNKNRSFCDYCGRQLKWYENVPVVSWLIQKGKTRCCHKKLSVSYPIVELMMGILFLINFQFPISNFQNFNFQLIFGFVIIVCLVFSAVFDLKYMILPDFSTGILIGCAIILLILNYIKGGHIGPPVQNILSALIAFGFLGSLYLITKGKGMGLGDVKYALFMGLFLGWQKTIIAFYVAFIVGAIIGIGLIILKKAKRNSLIPFGPFLILGTIVAWWWGDFMLNLIYKWF